MQLIPSNEIVNADCKKELQVQVTVRSNFLVQVQNCEYFFIQALNLQKSLYNINMFCYYFFPG